MRWIIEKDDFEAIRLGAATCKYVDSGRLSTSLQRWIFDDADICTPEFGALLQDLMRFSGDSHYNYVVLNPDPLYYFFHHFHKYPAIEIELGELPKTYLAALSEDPGGSPADAIGVNWWECVIVPPSARWFVHALRDDLDRGGHLWIPPEWSQRVLASFSYLRVKNE